MNSLSYFKCVTKNKSAIQNSIKCGCTYCLIIFDLVEVIDYCDEKKFIGITAICPYCSIDSVVSDYLIEITQDNLIKWHTEGFNSS